MKRNQQVTNKAVSNTHSVETVQRGESESWKS